MQHLDEQRLVGHLAADVSEMQVLLGPNTDQTDFGQSHKNLSEFVLHVRVKIKAILKECSIHFLLALFHVLTVAQTGDICNEHNTKLYINKCRPVVHGEILDNVCLCNMCNMYIIKILPIEFFFRFEQDSAF